MIDAEEALSIGLANRIVPHDALETTVMKMARRMAGKAPIPMALAKRGLQNFQKWDLPQALDYEAYALEICMKTEDVIEGFGAFLEKRDPDFKGR